MKLKKAIIALIPKNRNCFDTFTVTLIYFSGGNAIMAKNYSNDMDETRNSKNKYDNRSQNRSQNSSQNKSQNNYQNKTDNKTENNSQNNSY